jgi:hypothetical protein
MSENESSSSASVPMGGLASSSEPPPMQMLWNAQQAPSPNSSSSDGSWLDKAEKWFIPIITMILAGVIGHYSAIIQLKDEITGNKMEIVGVKKDIEYAHSDINKIHDEMKVLPEIRSDIAVMKNRIEVSQSKR